MGGGGGVGVSNSKVSRKHPEELERTLRDGGAWSYLNRGIVPLDETWYTDLECAIFLVG